MTHSRWTDSLTRAAEASRWMTIGGIMLFAGCTLLAQQTVAPDSLKQGFADPPNSARPRVWWHWLDGNISPTGAELDLTWMKRAGIGGVHILFGGGFHEPLVVPTYVPFMGPTWKGAFANSVRFGEDNGMEVTIAGSPGWSETGGPWVAPEDAMKKYVWGTTNVDADHTVPIILPHPPITTGPFLGVRVNRSAAPPSELKGDLYRDTVVVAFPTPAAEEASTQAYSGSAGPVDFHALETSDLANTVDIPVAAGQSGAWIVASFDKPVMLYALTLGIRQRVNIEIQFSRDAAHLTTLLKIPANTLRNYIAFQANKKTFI
jgi:hypothetical protein